jgi:hypothetical protein
MRVAFIGYWNGLNGVDVLLLSVTCQEPSTPKKKLLACVNESESSATPVEEAAFTVSSSA